MLTKALILLNKLDQYIYNNTIQVIFEPIILEAQILKKEGLTDEQILNHLTQQYLPWLNLENNYIYYLLFILSLYLVYRISYLLMNNYLFNSVRLKCFNCNQSTKFEKLRVNKKLWKCQWCKEMNFRDENGDLVDFTPLMAKERNIGFTLRSGNKLQEPNSFCSDCLKNLQFQTQALADYLPSDEDAEYKSKYNTIEEYKLKLNNQYPIGCNNCIGYQQFLKKQY